MSLAVRLEIIVAILTSALIVGCKPPPPATGAADGGNDAEPVNVERLPDGVKPSAPLTIAVPKAESKMNGDRDFSTLRPQVLRYLAHQFRSAGKREEMLQCDYWAVNNGGGSQYNLACSYALNGRVSESLYWLQRAAMEEGVDPKHSLRDSDLEFVRRDQRWPAVYSYIAQAAGYWNKSGLHEEILILPSGHQKGSQISVVIGLHGLGSSAADFSTSVDQEFSNVFEVAVLHVSGTLPIGPKSFVWSENHEENAQRIEQALKEVSDRMSMPTQRIVFGFSQGATVAMEVAARHPARYAGAISLSAGAEKNPVAADFPAHPSRAGQSFVLVCGAEEHPMTVQTTERYAALLKGLGSDVTHRAYPGIKEHSFPPDFDEQFPAWVKSIFSPQNSNP